MSSMNVKMAPSLELTEDFSIIQNRNLNGQIVLKVRFVYHTYHKQGRNLNKICLCKKVKYDNPMDRADIEIYIQAYKLTGRHTD